MRNLPTFIKKILIAVIIISGVIVAASVCDELYNPGPIQPVPFSHRIHAGAKSISCFFCHPNASYSSNAGIPPVEKCLLCHNVIASNFAPIKNLRQYAAQKKGVPWVRIVQLPDFVRFSHQAHIAGRKDCSECHGNVKAMDRVKLAKTIDMNFCITCHKRNNVSVDCYICHY